MPCTASSPPTSPATRAESPWAEPETLCRLVHDLRSPLSGMVGLSRLLAGRAHTPEEVRMLGLLARTGEHVLGIVNDLLDYVSMTNGSTQLRPSETRLEPLVRDTLDLLGPKAAERATELAVSFDAAVPASARLDARCLQRLLTNLVSNAIDFTPAGRVEIAVRSLPAAEPAGAYVHLLRFEIRDTGIGIPESERGRIFEPFAQGTAGRVRGGNGMGLAICRELVKLHGGRIGVESREWKGSTFWFELPLHEAAAPWQHPEPTRESAHTCLKEPIAA